MACAFLVLDYVFIKQSNSGSFLFDRPWKKHLHTLIAFFILHNVLGNLYKIVTVDSSIKNIMLTQIRSTNQWNFCSVCECLTPPRSFHCRFVEKEILNFLILNSSFLSLDNAKFVF